MLKIKMFALIAVAMSALTSESFAQEAGSNSMNGDTTFSKSERSGFFIEPLIQTSREDASIRTSQLPGLSDTSGTTQGYGLGLKVGGHVNDAIFLGVDARYAKTRFQDSAYQTADGDQYNYGPTAGVQFPNWGLRLMASYVAGGEFNPGPGAQGVDLKFRDPRGWRGGVGFHVASASINLEYENLVYDKTDIQSFGSLVGGNASTNVDYENRGYALSVSFPVEL